MTRTLRNLAKFCFCIWALVFVWMIFHGKLVKSFFDLTFRSIFRHAEDVVVVFFGQYKFCYHQDAHCEHQC